MTDLDDLIDRLKSARNGLMELAQRPTNTLSEQHRLLAKCEGVNLALSFAREYARGGAA